MSNYILFLDDIRSPIDCMSYMLGRIFDINMYRKPDWRIVKNYKEFKDVILNEGVPDFISLDHDLADVHYMKDVTDSPACYNDANLREKTGYDCAAFLIEYCIDNDIQFPPFACHSQNPVGTQNINQLIRNFKKYQDASKSRTQLRG